MRDVCEETTRISGRPISINNLEGYLRINNILIRSVDAAPSLCHKDHTHKQSMLLDKISKMRFTL